MNIVKKLRIHQVYSLNPHFYISSIHSPLKNTPKHQVYTLARRFFHSFSPPERWFAYQEKDQSRLPWCRKPLYFLTFSAPLLRHQGYTLNMARSSEKISIWLLKLIRFTQFLLPCLLYSVLIDTDPTCYWFNRLETDPAKQIKNNSKMWTYDQLTQSPSPDQGWSIDHTRSGSDILINWSGYRFDWSRFWFMNIWS